MWRTGRYPRENSRKGKREKKEERKKKRWLQREETVATVGERTRLLTWEVVLERRSFVSEVDAVLVETVCI